MAKRTGNFIIPACLIFLIWPDMLQAEDQLIRKEPVFSTDLSDWSFVDPSDLPALTAQKQYQMAPDMLPEHSMVPLPPALIGTASLGAIWLVRRGYKTAVKIKRNNHRRKYL